MKRAAIVMLVVAAIAGCSSTVVLGSLPPQPPPIDFAQPIIFDFAGDAFDGGTGDFALFFDGGSIDLAQ